MLAMLEQINLKLYCKYVYVIANYCDFVFCYRILVYQPTFCFLRHGFLGSLDVILENWRTRRRRSIKMCYVLSFWHKSPVSKSDWMSTNSSVWSWYDRRSCTGCLQYTFIACLTVPVFLYEFIVWFHLWDYTFWCDNSGCVTLNEVTVILTWGHNDCTDLILAAVTFTIRTSRTIIIVCHLCNKCWWQ